MMNPITLTISTGRCGTTFLENTFLENFGNAPGWISHEYLRQQVTNVGVYHRSYTEDQWRDMLTPDIIGLLEEWKAIARQGPVVDFGWTMRSLIPFFYKNLGSQLRVIHIHRHPVSVAASFKLIGSYSIYNSPQWAITPFHPRALFPQFQDRWDKMTAFEKCLYLWLEVNGFALELQQKYPDLDMLTLRSSDLFRSDNVLTQVGTFTGFCDKEVPITRSEKRNPRNLFLLERWPIQEEWQFYERHPEVVEFAESLEYNMSKDFVAELIKKYQLPAGVLPWIRNKTGYWAFREQAGNLLRKARLRPKR